MCNLGQFYSDPRGYCDVCGKKSSDNALETAPVKMESQIDELLTEKIIQAVMAQGQILKDLEDIANLIKTSMHGFFNTTTHPATTPSSLTPVPENLQLINNSINLNQNYLYSIITEDILPQPVYKKKPFSLHLKIVDANGMEKSLEHPIKFKIILCTSSLPNKMLTYNASGDRIMFGTLEVDGSSDIHFRKIVINDVSSKTENGVFSLIIMTNDVDYIKPLEIKNVRVKTQKSNTQAPKKRRNIEHNNRKPEIE
ncbi:hypothetical protein SteCoe_12621 [Stentor coeruleus]|uniref:Uncharacterized protein n=1 Tax=Stentor coeruleus TaxID=5963 RepID=A0A1R2CAF3_9CILI|nr:hypothetical protein SteCoe_12621 [Stentor coeruleus]